MGKRVVFANLNFHNGLVIHAGGDTNLSFR
jgi:hypothetical protein